MPRHFKAKPSRQQVLKSLAELAQLWARPPDPGKEKPASAGTDKRVQDNADTENHTPARPRKAAQ